MYGVLVARSLEKELPPIGRGGCGFFGTLIRTMTARPRIGRFLLFFLGFMTDEQTHKAFRAA